MTTTLYVILWLFGIHIQPNHVISKTIILQNHLGNTFSIISSDGCFVHESEHESISWSCNGRTEIRFKNQESETYYWTDGNGGVIGGGWRVKR